MVRVNKNGQINKVMQMTPMLLRVAPSVERFSSPQSPFSHLIPFHTEKCICTESFSPMLSEGTVTQCRYLAAKANTGLIQLHVVSMYFYSGTLRPGCGSLQGGSQLRLTRSLQSHTFCILLTQCIVTKNTNWQKCISSPFYIYFTVHINSIWANYNW